MFAGFLIKSFESLDQLTSAGKGAWITFVSSAALCLFCLLYLINRLQRSRLPKKLTVWVIGSGMIVSQMVVHSFLQLGEFDILHTARRGIPYVAMVVLPILGAPEFRQRLLRILKWHAVAGVFLAGLVIVRNWGVITASHVARQEGMEAKEGKPLLYAIYFLLFRFKELKMPLKLTVAGGLLELAIQGIASATRQAVALLGMSLVMGGWAFMRQKTDKKKVSIVFGAIFFVVVMATSVPFLLTKFQGAIALTESRFAEDSGDASLKENSRFGELKAFFGQQASLFDYMFGRGVNGGWEHVHGLDGQTMHIGYGKFILLGGLPLLFVIFAGPVCIGFYLWITAREPLILAASGMCVWFGAKSLTGNIVNANLTWLLILISFGICLFHLDEAQALKVGKQNGEGEKDRFSSNLKTQSKDHHDQKNITRIGRFAIYRESGSANQGVDRK